MGKSHQMPLKKHNNKKAQPACKTKFFVSGHECLCLLPALHMWKHEPLQQKDHSKSYEFEDENLRSLLVEYVNLLIYFESMSYNTWSSKPLQLSLSHLAHQQLEQF